MSDKKSSFLNDLYDSKKKQLLGRDGAGWGKLGIFYFFFYVGLAGFFCAMLAVFMVLTPRDRPRYVSESSRMQTRSNPLTPGLGYRPQPDPGKNLIFVDKNGDVSDSNPYIKNLNQYLEIYYPKNVEMKGSSQGEQSGPDKFDINQPGDCTSQNNYGFSQGKPCVLVKMNKIVDFEPIPGASAEDKTEYESACQHNPDAIAVHCYGEYPADEDYIGDITYISENSHTTSCGAFETKWFPYRGKYNRQDVYQAPYIWVQFNKPKPNYLINVICRVYGENIYFDKKAGRGLTRFQIYVKDVPEQVSSRVAGEH